MPSDATIAGRAQIGKTAPAFTAIDLTGNRVSLASYRGKPLIVTFGASWCHPCREEYPLLVRAAAASDRFAVVGVMHEDLPKDARAFVHEVHASWPVVNDDSNAISSAYGVVGLPQTFFITATGVIEARVFGITTKSALDKPLNALLATS